MSTSKITPTPQAAATKATTNFKLKEYRSLPRGARNFIVKDYVADADAGYTDTLPNIIAYLRSLSAHAHDEEGDLTWQDKYGSTFFTGEKARNAIEAEITLLECGEHWSQDAEHQAFLTGGDQ